MNRQYSYSLQKNPIRKSLVRNNSQSQRLIFPKQGDNNIFWGVGKKHFNPSQQQLIYKIKLPDPQKINNKTKSVRNLLNVADIQGASPSVAPEKVKNILRGKQYIQKQRSLKTQDTLGQYQKIFNLKQLSPTKILKQDKQIWKSSNSIASMSPTVQPIRYNPTFVTSFSLHQ